VKTGGLETEGIQKGSFTRFMPHAQKIGRC